MRENGGQYTHGAVWLALACLRLGRTEDGLELLRALLPERRRTQIYQAEPYVLAADVYAAPGHLGPGRLELVHRGGRGGTTAPRWRSCWA